MPACVCLGMSLHLVQSKGVGVANVKGFACPITFMLGPSSAHELCVQTACASNLSGGVVFNLFVVSFCFGVRVEVVTIGTYVRAHFESQALRLSACIFKLTVVVAVARQ